MGHECLSLYIVETLADEDTSSILTDNANRAIQGNVAIQVTQVAPSDGQYIYQSQNLSYCAFCNPKQFLFFLFVNFSFFVFCNIKDFLCEEVYTLYNLCIFGTFCMFFNCFVCLIYWFRVTF